MRRFISLSVTIAIAILSQASITHGYYWFDQESTVRQSTIVSGKMQIDAGTLRDGFHTLFYMVSDDQGRFSAPAHSYFAVFSSIGISQSFTCKYIIDNGQAINAPGTFSSNRLNLNIDASQLPTGFHSIDVLICGNNGFTSKGPRGYFIKYPDSDGSIKSIIRWVNSSEEILPKINLENPTFLIQDVWQMPDVAFSTDRFDLNVEGNATAISRNELEIILTDKVGRSAFAFATYNDMRQIQAVEAAGDITGGGEFSHPAPEDGQITWWTFRGAQGDSISLRASRSSTLQLFAPDGTEMMKATKTDATTAWSTSINKKGTYYVAQHSTTGTNDLKLIFFHKHLLYGDVDGSAMVDVDDVNAMINLILNYDQYKDQYPGSADLDGNGLVDVDDVNALINIILAQ